MNWTLAVNIVGIILLIAVLVYAYRLNRKLQILESTKADTQKFLTAFTDAIARAELAIQHLRRTAHEAGEEIDQHFTKATSLRDELSFLVDAADRIANRITDKTHKAQIDAQTAAPTQLQTKHVQANMQAHAAAQAQAQSKIADKKREIKEEAKTVKPVRVREDESNKLPAWLKAAPQSVPVNEEKQSKPEEFVAAVSPLASSAKLSGTPLRSEAERELQQALEKMR